MKSAENARRAPKYKSHPITAHPTLNHLIHDPTLHPALCGSHHWHRVHITVAKRAAWKTTSSRTRGGATE